MTNRTIEIYGYAYSTSTANVVATVNGTQVFSGNLPLSGTELPELSAALTPPENVLFTFELPLAFDGIVPITIQIISGDVIFATVGANYNTANDSGVVDQFYDVYPSGPDCRSNVIIDGVVVDLPPHTEPGDYWYTVLEGSSIDYDLSVTGGIDNTAPVITVQPQSASVVAPATTSFSATATISNGATLTYQWQRQSVGSGVWQDISGATTDSYTTNATQTAYNGTGYRLRVASSLGTQITLSEPAVLTVTA
jgi:hypothetical protein